MATIKYIDKVTTTRSFRRRATIKYINTLRQGSSEEEEEEGLR